MEEYILLAYFYRRSAIQNLLFFPDKYYLQVKPVEIESVPEAWVFQGAYGATDLPENLLPPAIIQFYLEQ